MPNTEDRKTPIPVGIHKSHTKRISDLEERASALEEGQGKLAGDIGNLKKNIEGSHSDSDRPSAQFSISPTGARAKLLNIKGKYVISIIVVIALMFVIIAWIVGKK